MRGVAQQAVCPRCEQASPPTGERLITCRACGMSFTPRDPSARARTRRRESSGDLPRGMSLARAGDMLTIHVHQSGAIGIVILVISAPLAVIPIVTTLKVFYATGPFLLLFAYLAIAALGSIEYVLDATELRVRHRPLPMGRTIRIAIAETTDVEVDSKQTRHGWRHSVHVLHVDESGFRSVLTHPDEAVAIALRDVLRGELVDRRARGRQLAHDPAPDHGAGSDDV